jgi:hypothetical protein
LPLACAPVRALPGRLVSLIPGSYKLNLSNFTGLLTGGFLHMPCWCSRSQHLPGKRPPAFRRSL